MHSFLSRFVRFALLSAVLASFVATALMWTTPVSADDLYASIRGVATDPSGAIVPDVSVTVTNVATGVTYHEMTTKDGTYSFLQVAIGDYSLKAEKSGFRRFETTRIHLDLNQVFTQDLKMEVGTISQEVIVQADPVQVNTVTPQLGAIVDSEQIVDLPLIGRNWINLQQLEPGVVAASDGRGNFATNGSQSQQNSFLLNGTDINDLPLNTPLLIPSPDAISEFQLVTGTINPEYGRNSGAIVSAIIKSGTNQFHGTGFDFYRDTFLDARNFFQSTNSPFQQNQFGGVVGGPIKKNHLFGFFSYQGIRSAAPQAATPSVAVYPTSQLDVTNLNAGANFGSTVIGNNHLSPIALVGSDGNNYPAGTPYSTIFGCGGGTTPGCTQGFIPFADFNPISTKLIKAFVPAPNGGGNTFNFNPTQLSKQDQYIGRVDYNVTQNDTIWSTLFFQHSPRSETIPFTGATLPGFGETDDVHSKQFVASWTHVFNGHMLNELRFGYTRLNFNAVDPTTSVAPSSFGFNITPQLTGGEGLPVITVLGNAANPLAASFSLGFSTNGPQPRIDQTYEAVDNFSITYGRHTIKFGYDGRRFQVFNPFAGQNDGDFSFVGNGAFSTGDGSADFLLGIPDNYGQGSGGIVDARSYQHYSYFQDAYKLRSNFTITYGVGWQIDQPIIDYANDGHAGFAFRPGQQSIVFPGAPLGYVFQGDPGVHASGSTHAFRQFGPRLGFAWSPSGGPQWLTGGVGKLSVRGGYGIFYNRSEEEQTLQFLGGAPFTFSTTGAANPSFPNPFQNIATGATQANPFPFAGPGQNVNFAPFLPLYQFVSGVDPATRSPYSENFNLTVERQLPSSIIVSLGYVGAVAHHLANGFPINIATNLTTCAQDPACLGNPVSSPFLHPEDFLYNPNIYGTIDDIATGANSNYSAFEAKVHKAVTHGLLFEASYTWSHAIDEASGFENSVFGGGGFGGFGSLRASNPYSLKSDYASSIFDARHRLVMNYVYTIPGPRGIEKSSLLGRAVNGWNIAGITTFQTGFPLDVIDSSFNSQTCIFVIQDFACPDGPNLSGPIAYTNPHVNTTPGTPGPNGTYLWFSNANGAFTPQGGLTLANAANPASILGDAPRNVLRGPGLNNWDFELFKDTRITESTRLELRFEAYNIFNHTQFNPNGISTNIESSNFGRVRSAFNPRQMQIAAKFYF